MCLIMLDFLSGGLDARLRDRSEDARGQRFA
jgi:hypothetical protein